MMGGKAGGFTRVLNVITELEHWECLMGLFDSVCVHVSLCVCVYLCGVRQL